MTDLEQFLKLYASFGITLAAAEFFHEPQSYPTMPDGEDRAQLHVELGEGDNPKFGGYRGFGSTVRFTLAGAFIAQDFWE